MAAARALWAADVPVHGMVHVSGGGLLNVLRLAAPVRFVLDALPNPPEIFGTIRNAGHVALEEMYATFNMGIGLCVVVPEHAVAPTVAAVSGAGEEASVIGRVVEGPERRVELPEVGVVGRGDTFSLR